MSKKNCVVDDRFAEAFDSIAWYEGYEEWLAEVSADLKAVKPGRYLSNPLMLEAWGSVQHALWMMLVSAFGDWGTSIRGGWIEKTEEAAQFIDAVLKQHEEVLLE